MHHFWTIWGFDNLIGLKNFSMNFHETKSLVSECTRDSVCLCVCVFITCFLLEQKFLNANFGKPAGEIIAD